MSACQHASRLTLADAGGGGGIDAGGGGGDGDGEGSGGGTGDEGGGPGAGNGDGDGDGDGDGTGGGGATGGGGTGGDDDDDQPGGGGDDDDGGGGSTPASYPGGIEELTELLAGSGGALLYSSGNTIASPHLGQLGAALRDDGVAALPVGDRLASGVVQAADTATAPVGKLTITDQMVLGSGDPDGAQLAGLALASSTSAEGSLASVNVANTDNAGVSASLAGGDLASVSALQSGVLNPTGEGAALDVSLANGDVAAISVLPTGVSGSQNLDSLLGANLGGETPVSGGENAAINLDVLPEGAAGIASLTDAADLNALLAPVDNGHLAPVTAKAQTVIDGASHLVGAFGGSAPSTDPLAGLVGDSHGQVAVTVLDAPLLGDDSASQLIGVAAVSSHDDAGALASINALNAGGAVASVDIAGGDIASVTVLPGVDAADITGALAGLGDDPGSRPHDLAGDLTNGLAETEVSGPGDTIGEGLEGLGAGLEAGLGGLFR